MNSRPGVTATTSGSQISDFRFQSEGCLMQTGYLSQKRMQVQFPPSALSESVLCTLKSAISNVQSIIVLPGVLGCRPLRRTVQVRLGTNPALPRDGCPVARPSSWSRDSNS
jgi:hypothetical protein